MARFWLILIIPFLAACSTMKVADNDEIDNGLNYQVAQAQALENLRSEGESDDPPSLVVQESELVKEEAPQQTQPKKEKIVYQMLPTKKIDKVEKWIHYYSVKDRERFQRFLVRGSKYKDIVQKLLIINNLPPDLYYLGILESGYVTDAVSRVGATGPWQFMGPTGREYGLQINNYVDERLDPIRSTMAAIRYLKELYRQKKSWHLALAAYNAGPGRIRGAMRRGQTRNYWDLVNRRLLPYDTREYIPQFLAILTIGQDLKKYGFHERPDEVFPRIELVKLPSPLKLSDIAESSGVELETLQALNPHLLRGYTAPNKKTYSVWVPKDHVERAKSQVDYLASKKVEGLRDYQSISRYRGRAQTYRIQRGQTLSHVARKYGTSVQKLKRLNGLSSNRVYVGQKIKVRGSLPRASRKVASKDYHIVQSGEHLTMIAKQNGVSVSDLRQANNLKRDTLYVGQKLKLKRLVASAKSKKLRYKIKSGDNLFKIAKRFGTTVKRIKALNALKSSTVFRGQIILVASRD